MSNSTTTGLRYERQFPGILPSARTLKPTPAGLSSSSRIRCGGVPLWSARQVPLSRISRPLPDLEVDPPDSSLSSKDDDSTLSRLAAPLGPCPCSCLFFPCPWVWRAGLGISSGVSLGVSCFRASLHWSRPWLALLDS